MDYYKEGQLSKKYDRLRLQYRVTEDENIYDINGENLPLIKEALDAVGVYLDVSDGVLTLSIMPRPYVRTQNRGAGRRKARSYTHDVEGINIYSYSDIIYMSQTMKDQDIIEKIKMKPATFYRHKKEMRETAYYKSLDRSRLGDLEYLRSVNGDFMF
jgi:hypothetical protein